MKYKKSYLTVAHFNLSGANTLRFDVFGDGDFGDVAQFDSFVYGVRVVHFGAVGDVPTYYPIVPYDDPNSFGKLAALLEYPDTIDAPLFASRLRNYLSVDVVDAGIVAALNADIANVLIEGYQLECDLVATGVRYGGGALTGEAGGYNYVRIFDAQSTLNVHSVDVPAAEAIPEGAVLDGGQTIFKNIFNNE